jgi:cytochrome c553
MYIPLKLSPYLSAWIISTILALSATNIAFALKPGDPVAGQEKSSLCQGCHGEDGMSGSGEFPRLAGQHAGYLRKQFFEFQKKIRGNSDIMLDMSQEIPEKQDVHDIMAYFASQKKMTGEKLDKDVSKGKNIFLNGNSETGLYGCVNCHGVDGKGKAPGNEVFPVIGGQHKEYLVKQLTELRNASRPPSPDLVIRTNDPAGMMRNIASRLSDEEIDAVTDYLSQL